MINYYLKYKARKISSIPPSIEDIKVSGKILFSIFTRYGDTIIDLVIIKEFVNKYPNKEYLIICPKQMEPYVNEILPNIHCFAFNKRNLIEFISVIRLLKNKVFDIGFNPWSNGLDSSFFLSFCNKFLFYKDFDRPSIINHYQVVRQYLKLPQKEWKINKLILKKSYKKILICPQSTDINRSIPNDQLDKLIQNCNKLYDRPQIIIASMDVAYFRDTCVNLKLKKSVDSSKLFLSVMRQSSLVVCSDSGPLHIALALKKDLIAFMISTRSQDVINSGSSIKIINSSKFLYD
jgi:ADP-heptose:LPS heptosyltransferase